MTHAPSFMPGLIRHLIEADEDDFSVKDVVAMEPQAGETRVKRHGRWKLVDMPGYTFLISYLTPVAYLDKAAGIYYQTKKQWSPTTSSHISKWQHLIWKSKEWQEDPANWEPSEHNPEGDHYVRYPRFQRTRQNIISNLFKTLMVTMRMPKAHKKRLYHVPPTMRSGLTGVQRAQNYGYSGHNKFHNAGDQALPGPRDPEHRGFFDFEPDDPEYWDWSSGQRNQEPHEPAD